MTYEDTAITAAAERFARETAHHEMTVLHDDGLYRHLRFNDARPRYSGYWFDLITVPGALIFQGDGETFSFRRTDDMFAFIRGSSWNGGINAGYWAEKLTTDRDSVMRYDEELFNQTVAEELKEAETDYPGITKAWREETESFLAEYNLGFENEAREALADFKYGDTYTASCSCGASETFTDSIEATLWGSRHRASSAGMHRTSEKHTEGFRFTDTWEWNLQSYYWWFLWACHAIVWGIRQYDAQHVPVAAAAGETR